MKRTFTKTLLSVLCLLLLSANTVLAEDNVSLTAANVFMTYREGEDEITKNVLYQVAELDGDVMQDLHFDIEMTETGEFSYRLVQYDASAKRHSEIISSPSASFDISSVDLRTGIPLYLCVFDKAGSNVSNRLLTVRVNQGKLSQSFPEKIASEYDSAITLPMDELLPGMNFNLPPYFLPISAKAYTDGRFVLGIGINSTNTSFWKDAAQGKIGTGATGSDLEKAFYGDSKKRSAVEGSDMGLIFDAAGWVQGNSYTKDPLKGELNVFIGTGFAAEGQYAILTWSVTVMGGANGVLQFELKYDESKSKYSDFLVDRFGIGFKTSLELYGGLGLSSLASIGIYGAGSMGGYTIFYPKTEMDSLVLAGEAGFKVKLFSRTLFSYAIVSGSHDFVRDRKGGLLNFYQQANIDEMLLASNYASSSGKIDEPDTVGHWYTHGSDPDLLTSYEDDPDFEHLVASQIYPDSRLQIVDTSSANIPQNNIIFLASDPSRNNGNRSRLMNFYFDENKNFLSDPDWIVQNDTTADFDPYSYRSHDGNTYLIWRNAVKDLDESTSIAQIAANTDLWFAKHYVSLEWNDLSRITEYAGNEEDVFAAGAKVFDGESGTPTVTYYLGDVNDPLSLDPYVSHDVCKAVMQEDGQWENELQFSLTGAIRELDGKSFGGTDSFALSYSAADESGNKTDKIAMFQDGEKVFERDNAYNARFLDCGSSGAILTWMEDWKLYGLSEDFSIMQITPDDLKIPSSDYKLYGCYGSSYVVLMGTVSKDSSENAYAIFSTDGGTNWAKSDLTDIKENASVSDTALAFTEEDEPVLFYAVQNYQTAYDPEDTDASNFLSADSGSECFAGLKSFALSEDDPRFIDTTADLYVKARRSNSRLEIIDGSFDEEDEARKGKQIPFTLQILNKGLYPVASVDLYKDGEYFTTLSADLQPGKSGEVKASLYLDENCSDETQTYEMAASCFGREPVGSYDLTLDTGDIAVTYDHELVYMNEILHWSVKNEGFAEKTVHTVIVDADTGEKISEGSMTIPGGHTKNSEYSDTQGVWCQHGHKNLKAYIFLDGESIEDLGSTRFVSFRSLEEIYIQDFSKIFNNGSTTPRPDPTPEPETPAYDHEPIDGDYKIPVTYVTDTPHTAPEPRPAKEEDRKEEVRPQTPADNHTGEAAQPQTAKPEAVQGQETRTAFPRLIVLPALLIIGLLLLLLFAILRRKEEEE
ncbi:MAG: hypothetical protein K5648_05085 [Erysipelotrichaceae bacterium]|nr:hypothetical protein [Erysipelotrichaceae bacterium]